MRICLVSQEYPPETAKGGIGTQTFVKAQGLAELGHEIYVISRSPSVQRTEVRTGNVMVIRIPAPSVRFPIHTEVADWISYSAEVAAAVSVLHQQVELDLVDFPEWGCEGYVFLLNRTQWNHLPAVIHLHGPLVMFAHTMDWPDRKSEFYRTGTLMEETCLRLADSVYSSSRCSAEWCARHYGLDAARIPIIHTGVDTTLFSPGNGPKDDRPTVIFVGRIAHNKGVFELLEACAALAEKVPRLRLRVLGNGEVTTVEELQDRATALGCSGLLDLAGYVPREHLPEQLRRAHLFAAPSIYEGGPGFVYLEAMACGLPVIACEGSGAAEVVRPGENGLLVPPGDVPALTAALRTLLENSAQREALSRAARKMALEEACSRSCLRTLESFYRAVSAGHVPPTA